MSDYFEGPPPSDAQKAAATVRFAHMRRQLTEGAPPLHTGFKPVSDGRLDRLTRELSDNQDEEN